MKDLKFSTASKEMYGEVGNCVVCDQEVHPGTVDAYAVLCHRHLLCNECCAAMLEGRRVMKEMIKQGKMEDSEKSFHIGVHEKDVKEFLMEESENTPKIPE